jgi:hypothetical protein
MNPQVVDVIMAQLPPKVREAVKSLAMQPAELDD